MNLQTKDKIIVGFYIFLAVSFLSGILYISTSFDDLPEPSWVIKQIKEMEFERTLDINKEKLFLTMTDIENYPKILPRNFISVNIVERNDNVIIAEEEIQEKGIRSKFLVKHTLIPYNEHTIEILDGNAKGTTIHQRFLADGNYTKLKTKMDINFQGILIPFSYLPESNIRHAMDTVTTSFYEYAKLKDSPIKKQIDQLYRDILLRPADKGGLEHYTLLLKTNQMSISDIRSELSNSKEAKHIVRPNELKNIPELSDQTKEKIDQLYREILLRPADKAGIEHYGTLLELDKLTLSEIEESLFNSQEALSMRLSTPNNKLIDDLYFEIHDRHADWDTLQYYRTLLENKTMTPEEIKEDMLNNSDLS